MESRGYCLIWDVVKQSLARLESTAGERVPRTNGLRAFEQLPALSTQYRDHFMIFQMNYTYHP